MTRPTARIRSLAGAAGVAWADPVSADILYGRRQPGRVRPGNCRLVVASVREADSAGA